MQQHRRGVALDNLGIDGQHPRCLGRVPEMPGMFVGALPGFGQCQVGGFHCERGGGTAVGHHQAACGRHARQMGTVSHRQSSSQVHAGCRRWVFAERHEDVPKVHQGLHSLRGPVGPAQAQLQAYALCDPPN